MEKDVLKKVENVKASLEAALAEVQSLNECSTAEERLKRLQECSNLISEAQEELNPLIG